MVDGEVMHDAFFGLGDVTAGLEVLGLIREQSEDFDQLVEELLNNMPENPDFRDHVSAVYEYLKKTREP